MKKFLLSLLFAIVFVQIGDVAVNPAKVVAIRQVGDRCQLYLEDVERTFMVPGKIETVLGLLEGGES